MPAQDFAYRPHSPGEIIVAVSFDPASGVNVPAMFNQLIANFQGAVADQNAQDLELWTRFGACTLSNNASYSNDFEQILHESLTQLREVFERKNEHLERPFQDAFQQIFDENEGCARFDSRREGQKGWVTVYVPVKTGLVDLAMDCVLYLLALELGLRLTSLGAFDNIKFEGVSPAWMFGSAMGGIITGGPGAEPVAAPDGDVAKVILNITATGNIDLPSITDLTGTRANPATVVEPNKDQVKDNFGVAGETDVPVYILDTVPSENQLNCAKQLYPGNGFLVDIVDRILAGDINRFYYDDIHDDEFSLNMAAGFSLDRAMYRLDDHGSFIASIIAVNAPSAKLNLVQVLNRFGLGTSQSMICGLETTIREINNLPGEGLDQGKKAVVNCSLTIGFPEIDLSNPPADWDEKNPCERFLAYLQVVLNHIELIQVLTPLFVELSDIAHVVSAAGNDARGNTTVVTAAFPGALGGILGIGAEKGNGEKAKYSRHPASQPGEGFWVFGGEALEKTKKGETYYLTDAQNGILGLYILDHYGTGGNGPVVNNNGWAYWAGTSFAAALFSASLASVISHGGGLNTIRGVVIGTTTYDKLPVRQG